MVQPQKMAVIVCYYSLSPDTLGHRFSSFVLVPAGPQPCPGLCPGALSKCLSEHCSLLLQTLDWQLSHGFVATQPACPLTVHRLAPQPLPAQPSHNEPFVVNTHTPTVPHSAPPLCLPGTPPPCEFLLSFHSLSVYDPGEPSPSVACAATTLPNSGAPRVTPWDHTCSQVAPRLRESLLASLGPA